MSFCSTEHFPNLLCLLFSVLSSAIPHVGVMLVCFPQSVSESHMVLGPFRGHHIQLRGHCIKDIGLLFLQDVAP